MADEAIREFAAAGELPALANSPDRRRRLTEVIREDCLRDYGELFADDDAA